MKYTHLDFNQHGNAMHNFEIGTEDGTVAEVNVARRLAARFTGGERAGKLKPSARPASVTIMSTWPRDGYGLTKEQSDELDNFVLGLGQEMVDRLLVKVAEITSSPAPCSGDYHDEEDEELA